MLAKQFFISRKGCTKYHRGMDSRSSAREDLERPQELCFERNAEYLARHNRDESKVEERITINQQPWPSLKNMNDSTGPGVLEERAPIRRSDRREEV